MIDKCEGFSALLNDYLDNNLTEDQLKSLEQHLASCNNCKEELKDLKETIEKVNQLKDINIPKAKSSFSADIINQLRTETKPVKVSYFKYIAASVIVIGLVCFAVINFSGNKGTNISQNNNSSITEEEYDEYFATFTEDQDTFLIAEAGYPTDEYGLLDIDGIMTDE